MYVTAEFHVCEGQQFARLFQHGAINWKSLRKTPPLYTFLKEILPDPLRKTGQIQESSTP